MSNLASNKSVKVNHISRVTLASVDYQKVSENSKTSGKGVVCGSHIGKYVPPPQKKTHTHIYLTMMDNQLLTEKRSKNKTRVAATTLIIRPVTTALNLTCC